MFSSLIRKIQQDKYYFSMVASFAALFVAYFSEIVWHLNACMLCLYQRLDYFFILGISVIAIIIPFLRRPLSFILIILLMAEVVLAAYHVGVEHHLIEESYMCSTQTEISSNIQRFLSFKKVSSSCSEAYFKFMNFSMAEWNLLYSAILTYFFIKRRR